MLDLCRKRLLLIGALRGCCPQMQARDTVLDLCLKRLLLMGALRGCYWEVPEEAAADRCKRETRC